MPGDAAVGQPAVCVLCVVIATLAEAAAPDGYR